MMNFEDIEVKEVMIQKDELVTANPDDKVAAVILRMIRENIGGVPIVEKNKCVGIVTMRDIMFENLLLETNSKVVKMETVGIGEILDKPFDAVFGHFEALFAPVPSIFWAIVFSVVVMASFLKSEEDPAPPTILMIVLGVLFDGLIGGPIDVFFKIAVGAGIGIITFLIYKGRR